MNNKLSGLAVATAALLSLTARIHAQNPAITLDLDKAGPPVSPMLYGMMTEEINHSYDGGLYGELVQNRSFKDNATNPVHWSLVQDGGAGAMNLDQSQPINDALTTCLKLDVTNGGKRVGIANEGYWGIPIKPSTTYRLSLYAKATSPAPLTATLESNDGSKVFAQAIIPGVSSNWQKLDATLTVPAGIPPVDGRLVISTSAPGTYWFNLVSLFPPTWHGRPNGNRQDLMQLMSDMHPKFLRLPGGNFLEGDTIATRFQWQQTIHDISTRPGHPGCWGYRASDGLGLLEFLDWCEDLNIQPVLAVYAGYSLKGEHVNPGPDLQPYVDDALNEIEYATGEASTKWGAVRAQDGHPQPFKITYIEVGNEDGFDKSGTYDGRFAQFYDAIKRKYPSLKVISTAGGKDPVGIRQKVALRTPDAIDEHYYRSAGEMESDASHYDQYSRTGPKIFVGEWATREGSPTTNMNAALGDAAWMTGMERNSDVVVMASYAPLFVSVNPGGMEWKSDLIGYDALNSYGSPSYYAQSMFGAYLGDRIVPVALANIPTQSWQPRPRRNASPPPPQAIATIYASATRKSTAGTIFLKVVNIAATPQNLNISLKGANSVSPDGVSVVLTSANPADTNSIDHRLNITPATSRFKVTGATFSHTFAPYSVNVLQIECTGGQGLTTMR